MNITIEQENWDKLKKIVGEKDLSTVTNEELELIGAYAKNVLKECKRKARWASKFHRPFPSDLN